MKEYSIKVNGNDYTVSIVDIDDNNAEVLVNGTSFNVEFDIMGKPKPVGTPQVVSLPGESVTSPTAGASQPVAKKAAPAAQAGDEKPLKSPLPGVILSINVRVGDSVKVGDHIMVLEAMKMENNIDSDRDGVIKSISVSQGSSVLEGDVLVTIG